MPELLHRRRLDQPRAARRRVISFDPDTFGRLSERLARFLGTGKYLFWQTLIVVVWIAINLSAATLRWDPYPFILLNLAFSTQAAYAAPLILLAQNRQDDRDRIALEEDRARAERTKADTEYLARELASLRLAVGEVVTRDFLRSELARLVEVREPGQSEQGGADRPASDRPGPDRRGGPGSERPARGRGAPGRSAPGRSGTERAGGSRRGGTG
ncbi:DUF1003 domain-containing protein [Amycolatopsis sp.]|uniref:DUF1003 domain-containing protein n=1 Tax=Amycolatopsis sp. TaxID=37632 RepID=UPI002CC747C5|nr:DUF1003 domain-containing protein [Amycolatopsis sp.]HVV13704.1 DUF1003 domain-containing protein [Amycolatopsis sp.]